MRDFPRYAAAVAVFATALYVALVIATFGMTSLVLNRDVIADPSAGPLVGPVMTGVAVLVVFFSFLSIALRVPEAAQQVWIGRAVLIGIGAYFTFCFIGGILIGAASGELFGFTGFLGRQLLSPFAAAVGILAFAVALVFMLVLASHVGNKGRPRWPWEKHDDGA